LGLIGIILVLVSLKGLSEYYNDKEIFTNALYGFIFVLIGIIVALISFFAMFMTGAFFAFHPMLGVTGMLSLLVPLTVLFLFYLLRAFFYRKSFTILSQKSGERMFETVGLILLIGAALTIIAVSILILLIAWILATVAFFSMKARHRNHPQHSPSKSI